MNSNPLVSIIALCYNQERFCVETLNSIYDQTYKNIEVIIVDDASSDNSVKTIQKWISDYPGFNIRFIAHQSNQGICKSINEAFNYVKGEYTTLIASDDIMLPLKTERQISILEELNSDVALVYSDMIVINEIDEKISGSYFQLLDIKETEIQEPFYGLLERNFIPTPSVTYRTASLKSVGPFDEDLSFEDWDMFLRLTSKFKITFTEEKLVRYRQSDRSASNRRAEQEVKFIAPDFKILIKWVNYDKRANEILKKKLLDKIIFLYPINLKLTQSYLKEYKNYYEPPDNLIYHSINYGIPFTVFSYWKSAKRKLRSLLFKVGRIFRSGNYF